MGNTNKMTNIQLSYDEDKVEALKIFLEQKSSTIESELVVLLDSLYRKTVPLDVRNFIDVRSGRPPQVQKRRSRKLENNLEEK